MKALLSLLAILAAAPLGCGSSNALCSLESRAGVAVTLKDAATKKPVCDAKVIITDGDFRDEPTPLGPDCLYAGAHERVGTYRIEVTHPTLKPATRDGVKVDMDEAGCHVVAQEIAIELSAP